MANIRIRVSPEISQEIRDEVGTISGRARTKLVKRIAKRLGFSTHTIEGHARKTPGTAPSTVAVAPNGISKAPEAPEAPLDVRANLIEMQVNIAVWARRNEDYSNKLREMAYNIDAAIETLDTALRLMGLEEENQDLALKLQQADDQVASLRDIIDKMGEVKRRGDNPHIRGD